MKKFWASVLLFGVASCGTGQPAFAQTATWNELMKTYTIQDEKGDRIGVVKKRPFSDKDWVIEDNLGNRKAVIECDKYWCKKEKKK